MWKDTAGANSQIQWFPVQGNHDTWPVNIQDFSKPGINYAVNHLKETW